MDLFQNTSNDTIFEILYKMDYKEIYNFSISNIKIKEICKLEKFWEKKAFLDFNISKENFYKYIGKVTIKQRYVQFLVKSLLKNNLIISFSNWSIEKYVIIGNTGLGNSLIATSLNKYGIGMISLDEKTLHPPQPIYDDEYLFYDENNDMIPKNLYITLYDEKNIYGYHLNFMIQKLLEKSKNKINDNKIYQFTDIDNSFPQYMHVKAKSIEEAFLYFLAVCSEKIDIMWDIEVLWKKRNLIRDWIGQNNIDNYDTYTQDKIDVFITRISIFIKEIKIRGISII